MNVMSTKSSERGSTRDIFPQRSVRSLAKAQLTAALICLINLPLPPLHDRQPSHRVVREDFTEVAEVQYSGATRR